MARILQKVIGVTLLKGEIMAEMGAETVAGQGKNKSMMLLWGIIVLLLVVIAVGVTYILMRPAMATSELGNALAESTQAELDEQNKNTLYYSIEPAFIVNFHTPGRTRYLKVSVDLMTHDQKIVDAIKKHLPLIKNDLVALFSAQDFQALKTQEGKNSLQQNALAQVQKILTEQVGVPGVDRVLFTSFVVQ